MRNPILGQMFTNICHMFSKPNEEADIENSETRRRKQNNSNQNNDKEHESSANSISDDDSLKPRRVKKETNFKKSSNTEQTSKKSRFNSKSNKNDKSTRKELAKKKATVKQNDKKQHFDDKDKNVYTATKCSPDSYPHRSRQRGGLSKFRGNSQYRRSNLEEEHETSSPNSASSVDTRPCNLKLRRDNRRNLDILHDCVVYNQYDRPGRADTNAQTINEFLNSITNDIVDNKEPIPKDPLRLPALGAAGMYPTKKWLTDLRRKGIKAEPNKHYKNMRGIKTTKSNNYSAPKKNNYKVMRADSSCSSRKSSLGRTKNHEPEDRRRTFTKSLNRDNYLVGKRQDYKSRANAALERVRKLSKALTHRRRSPSYSDSNSD